MKNELVTIEEILSVSSQYQPGKCFCRLINTPLVGHHFSMQSNDMEKFLLVIASTTRSYYIVDRSVLLDYLYHWNSVGFFKAGDIIHELESK